MIRALRRVSLMVEEGKLLFILGPNGSGKTTLLKCMAKILKPHGGAVLVDGKNVYEMPRAFVSKIFGYVPQSSRPAELTVYDTVLLGRRPYFSWGPGRRDHEVTSKVIKLMGLEELMHRRLSELSGGELQKVAIARALAQEPRILLLDEPTSQLDIKSQIELMGILKKIVREKNIITVISTHDINLASLYADKIVMLKNGEIVVSGGPEVIDEENILRTYGVKATLIEVERGRRIILPIPG